ncbi:hypothetical protein [Novosphingobium sp.]|uniref:hypothetical protein n=1 Tax=Novosphingobium sp. TaxID=1874826 RepID=UPI0026386142|nr:hypothetical protein [Novosphingobium sp.]
MSTLSSPIPSITIPLGGITRLELSLKVPFGSLMRRLDAAASVATSASAELLSELPLASAEEWSVSQISPRFMISNTVCGRMLLPLCRAPISAAPLPLAVDARSAVLAAICRA